MLVIAFDGVLFDTLGARARAVCDALGHDVDELSMTTLCATVAGQSISEAVRALAAQNGTSVRNTGTIDETALDIACLRAELGFANVAVNGFALNMQARTLLQRAAATTRIVIRADSKRRQVDNLLELAELTTVAAFVRCSDDYSPVRHLDATATTIGQSYYRIAGRLAHQFGLLGESAGIGIALEASAAAQGVARHWGFDTPSDVSSVRFPGL